MREEWKVGEYVVYVNGEKFELGRIKSLRDHGAFVAYHEGEGGALTPYDTMHKIRNEWMIKYTTIGGDYFHSGELSMGDRIRELRQMNGYSQEQLAERAGYTDCSSIAKIENDEVDLPKSKIEALANALHVDPVTLMYGS